MNAREQVVIQAFDQAFDQVWDQVVYQMWLETNRRRDER